METDQRPQEPKGRFYSECSVSVLLDAAHEGENLALPLPFEHRFHFLALAFFSSFLTRSASLANFLLIALTFLIVAS
jgi:hypothetical protein